MSRRGFGGLGADERMKVQGNDAHIKTLRLGPAENGQRNIGRAGADVEDADRFAGPPASAEALELLYDQPAVPQQLIEYPNVRQRLAQTPGISTRLIHHLRLMP